MQVEDANPSARAGHDETASPGAREQDLERIFTRYMDQVYRFLYARLGNREDAEDLTSQVFLKASQQLDSAREEASIASWLFTVARTVLANHWRQYYRSPTPLTLNELVPDRSYEHSADKVPSGSEDVAGRILYALSHRYRQVLELRFLQGYSVDEAAREMGVTPANLRVMQHRALAKAAQIGFPDGERLPAAGNAGPNTRAQHRDVNGALQLCERTVT